MFWGVTLDSGKRYTQTVEKSFHLSMAALGFQNCSATPVTVMVEVDRAQFALCTLQPGKIPQQPLDYCFTEGEEITFFTEGPGDVHLTGYLMDEPNALEFEEDDDEMTAESEDSSESASEGSGSESEDDSLDDEITLGHLVQTGEIANDNDGDEDDDEESADDDWDPSKDNPKRKKRNKKDKKKTNSKEEQTVDMKEKKSKQTQGEQESLNSISNMLGESDDEDEDDESWTPEEKVETVYKAKNKATNKKDGNEKKRQNETLESREVQTETPRKKAKKKGNKNNKSQREENGTILDNNSESLNSLASPVNALNSVKSSKQKEHGKQQDQVETPQGSPAKKKNQSQATETKKRKLPGGVMLEDLKKGEGPVAKNGQKVHVYYKGNLAKNKKQFDACLSGTPFSFSLGAGEVIRGWDLGVAGMQVGGKRRLTVPPSQGYGNQRAGPIPPNSTLEFEVQLMRIQ